MEPKISNFKDKVQLATRQHLYSLLDFLDDKLPVYGAVYNHVLIHLRTGNPNDRVYFLRDSNGEYRVIIALRKDARLNDQNQLQIIWIVTSWAEDEETKVKVFESIEDINYETDDFVITSLNHEPHPVITAFFTRKQNVLKIYPSDMFTINRQAALSTELSLPKDVYIKSLETSHATTVYEYWPYNMTTTVDSVVRNIIETPSAGVFRKDTDQLVSWMTSRTPNGMSKLHTLEEFRQRGYASFVTRYLAKRMAQAGYQPYATIDPINESSKKCFRSTGFLETSPVHFLTVLGSNTK